MRPRVSVALACALLLLGCGDGAGPEALKTTAEAPLPWVWDGPSVPAPDAALDPSWDATYRLAAAHMTQDLAEANDTVELARLDPEILGTDGFEAIYNALARVYGRTDLAARDTVVEYCPALWGKGPPVEAVSVDIDSAGPWVESWVRGETATGEPAVDSLIAKYGLGVDTLRNGRYLPNWAELRGEQPLNMTGMARLLEGIEGIAQASPHDNAATVNWTLGAELVPAALVLTYRVGWGDCLSGCLAFHWWRFQVDGDGTVTYLGSGGEPLPGPDDPFGYEPVCQGP